MNMASHLLVRPGGDDSMSDVTNVWRRNGVRISGALHATLLRIGWLLLFGLLTPESGTLLVAQTPGSETAAVASPSEETGSDSAGGDSESSDSESSDSESSDSESSDSESGDSENSDSEEKKASPDVTDQGAAADRESEAGPGGSDQSAEKSDASEGGDDEDQPMLNLPLMDGAGRVFNAIGIYQSQLVELVPPGFRAVSIGELGKAVERSLAANPVSGRARLVSGFYDVRLDKQLLVSERSQIVIEHDGRQEVRQPLGEVNLALLDSVAAGRSRFLPIAALSPHLEVDSRGELVAVVPAAPRPIDSQNLGMGEPQTDPNEALSTRSEVRFGWTLQSDSLGTVKKFELQLPRTSLTRMVISTPSNIILESRQGVLVQHPGPPPEADVETRTGDIRWYVLEAGGLSRIELYARRQAEDESSQSIFVRRESKQYEVDLSGVSWKHRLTVELPQRRQRLRLLSPLGSVTAVGINSIDTPFQVLRRTDGRSLIDVDLPGGRYAPNRSGMATLSGEDPSLVDGELLTLTVEGKSAWDLREGTCELPSIVLMDADVVWTESSTQAVVSVMEPLDVAQWTLPKAWRQAVQTPTRAGESLLVGEGPPSENTSEDPVWSRLRLVQRVERSIKDIWTRMRLEQTPTPVLNATTRVRWQMYQSDQSPFRVEVHPDWTLDTVTVLGSQRQIDFPPAASSFAIWPTAAESSQATFEVEITGHRNLTGNRRRPQMPATWMVQPQQKVASHLVSLQPPKLRRWDGEAVMLPGRISREELDEEATAFFLPNSETLLLRSATGMSPSVSLEPLDVSLSVAIQVLVETDSDDVSQTIVVKAETSQPVTELSVLTGAGDEGGFDWSLRKTDQSVTVSLPSTSVSRPLNDPLGTNTIQLGQRDLREYELVGRRYLSAGSSWRLSLPSVRGATSQTAEVFLDPHWEVVDVPQGVQLVPAGRRESAANVVAFEQSQHLRYDPAMRPELELQPARQDEMTCLVWHQTVDVVAGSRSEDRFQLSATVSTLKPIHVRYDPDLELVSVSRNGSAYTPSRMSRGELWIDSELQSDSISVLLRRRHRSEEWLRRCKIPFVEIEGHVIRRRVNFRAAQGSLLLYSGGRSTADKSAEKVTADGATRAGSSGGAAVAESKRLSAGDDAIEGGGEGPSDSRPGIAFLAAPFAGELLLMPRNVAIGIGWLFSAVVFCLSWMLARWTRLGIHFLFVVVVLAISAGIIWWPWQLAMVGWIAVPVTLAALLHSVTRKSAPKQAGSDHSRTTTRHDDTRSQQPSGDASGDFSLSLPVTTLLIAIGVWVGMTKLASAQGMGNSNATFAGSQGETRVESGGSGVSSGAIELLVPLDSELRPVGDKVYLSESDYQSIQEEGSTDRPVDARFQSADYNVVLTPPRDLAQTIGVEIQADYQIRLPRSAKRVRLPVRADSLRRIELIVDGKSQIIRYSVDDDGGVIADVPASQFLDLRLTFIPGITTQSAGDPVARADATGGGDNELNQDPPDRQDTFIRLAIPPIHLANLVVEAPREIVVESLGRPLGRSFLRPELGRYEADLGRVSELSLRCHLAGRSAQTPIASLRRAYRLSAGINSTVVECEIDPPGGTLEGETVQLTIMGAAPTSVASPDWSLLPSEVGDSEDPAATAASNASGGIYRFEKQTSLDTPIRLMWRLPSVLNDPTSTSDSKVLPIPEVYASTSMRSAPTLFAIDSAPSIRVSELASGAQPASVEDFLRAWKGYPGKVERAFLVQDTFPSIVLLQEKYPEPTVSLEHRLHITGEQVELSVKANLIDLRPSLRRVQVAIPEGFEVIRCQVNGTPLSTVSLASAGVPEERGVHRELALGDGRVDGTMTVELIAERPLGLGSPWDLPRFEFIADGVIDETYRISRERSLAVELLPAIEVSPAAAESAEQSWQKSPLNPADLSAGRIPVAVSRTLADAQLKVTRRGGGDIFPSNQMTVMRYSGGQWSSDTLVELSPRRVPDYIDLEFPTRWSEGVSVTGALMWVQKSSSDANVTVLRVALPNDETNASGEPEPRRVLVTANFDNRDQSRIGVPAIRVLGAGARGLVIGVPDQLTTESIQWRRRSVRAVKPDPNWWKPFGVGLESPNNYSFYQIDGNNWAVELEPLSQATVAPAVLSMDARVYLNEDHALVYQRFDISPETRNEIELALPRHATCIGIWSAGREVDFGRQLPRDRSRNEAAETVGKIRVPLTYSRLPQSLEILTEVPVVDGQISDYLCPLLGIPTRNIWLGIYRGPKTANQRRQLEVDRSAELPESDRTSLVPLQRNRAVTFGQSVVTALDRSRDMLAERSKEEIESWLFPWIERYRTVSVEGGHLYRLPGNAAAEDDDKDPAQVVVGLDDNDPANLNRERLRQLRWEQLDRQLNQLAGRFLRPDIALPRPLFASERLSDFQVDSLMRLDDYSGAPKLVQGFTPRRGLQQVLVNSITLLTFGLGIVLLWPFRGRFQNWIREPALWLFVIGCLGLFLIPLPVALMLCLVSITLPAINFAKSRSLARSGG